MKKVISFKNLPARIPINQTILYIMALGLYGAPQWLWGVIGVLIFLLWVNWIYSVFNTEQIDISELLEAGLDEQPKDKKSNFRQLLDKQLEDAQKENERLKNK